MRKTLPASQTIVWSNGSYFFVRHFRLSFSEAELQMPLVNLTDIEIHFNFAGAG
jgi:hypothetical protein